MLADAGAEIARGLGQRRHEDVHGQRAAEGDQREQPEGSDHAAVSGVGVERAADMFQYPDRRLDVLVRQAGQRVAPDAARDRLDLVGDRAAARRQQDDLGPPVVSPSLRRIRPAASRLSSRRTTEELSSDIDAARSFWRGGVGRAGDMDQRQPGGLGQVEGLQPEIGGAPPLAGGARQQGAEGGAARRLCGRHAS